MTEPPPRWFIGSNPPEVASYERLVQHLGISPTVSAALDIMTDDGVPAERAASMALAAERSGKDPEAFARHFVKLRKVLR